VPGPLAGVRVVDLSRQGPGPMCAQILAELGADVVTVEPPAGDTRQRANLWLKNARALTRAITVDLKTDDGRDVVRRLGASGEIVLEGFRPGVAEKLGVDYAALSDAGANVVYVSISGYGQTGPYRLRPGHDINYIALAGVISLIGSEDGPPVAPGVLIADFAAGSLLAVVAVLAGLHELRSTGRGQYVDLSMHEAVVHTMARFLIPFLEGGPPARRGGDFLTGAAPWYGVYGTRDGGYLSVGAVEPHFYAALCDGIGVAELAESQWDEERWPAMRDAFATAFLARGRDEWVELLGDSCCVAAVLSPDEVAGDPHLRQRGVVAEDEGRLRLGPVVPVRGARSFHASDAVAGDPTASLLLELGYGDDDVARLRADGTVGTRI
jgi:alpha-methylacyl-CoA racemase